MEEESKTANGRRRWRQWTEEQGRAALGELAQSGLSLGKFAVFKGISVRRLAYWKKRLGDSGPTRFVGVDLSTAAASTGRRIEILFDGVTVRVREDIDAESLARVMDTIGRRPRGC